SELLAVYLLHRLGTAQRHLIDLLRGSLEQVIATDPRLAGRDADRTAHTLYLAVQGAVLSGPLAAPLADPRAWRAELDLLVRGYLRLGPITTPPQPTPPPCPPRGATASSPPCASARIPSTSW